MLKHLRKNLSKSMVLRSLKLTEETEVGEAGQRFGISMRFFHLSLSGASDRLDDKMPPELWNHLAPSFRAETCYRRV